MDNSIFTFYTDKISMIIFTDDANQLKTEKN